MTDSLLIIPINVKKNCLNCYILYFIYWHNLFFANHILCEVCFVITAVREDRSPGGKHRTKKPRFDSSMEDDNFSKLVENKQKLEDDHNELINVLLASQPDKIPDNECKILLYT
jgi:hypothetical protein